MAEQLHRPGTVFLFCGEVEIDKIQPLSAGTSKEEKTWPLPLLIAPPWLPMGTRPASERVCRRSAFFRVTMALPQWVCRKFTAPGFPVPQGCWGNVTSPSLSSFAVFPGPTGVPPDTWKAGNTLGPEPGHQTLPKTWWPNVLDFLRSSDWTTGDQSHSLSSPWTCLREYFWHFHEDYKFEPTKSKQVTESGECWREPWTTRRIS